MTQDQIDAAVLTARLTAEFLTPVIMAASPDNPMQVTADYKGYNENFETQKDWRVVIDAYLDKLQAAVLADLGVSTTVSGGSAGGGVPTP